MERQARSIESGTASRRMPHVVMSGRPLAIVAGLGAALARRPSAFFREDSASEEHPRTPAQRFWHAARFLSLLVPAVLLIGLLWVIWTRTANVPYWDEWETVLLDQQFKQGTLSFHDIIMLHATAHRIIIPRLIDLVLINLTNYNRQIEMTFSLVIAVASACILFWCARRTLGSLTATLALLAPLSLVFFSFGQFADWFAPFQVQFIVTVFGIACCVRGFAKTPVSRKGFALALAGALIGSFSGLHGVLTWIAFLPGAVHAGVRKAATWIGCAVAVWFLYFQHFPHQLRRISIRADITYSLTYLGGPVGYPQPSLALIAGIASVLALVGSVWLYWMRHRSLWHIAPWLQLALFVLGCTQATAEGRVTGGAESALASRYEAFSALWWIALMVIMGLNIKELLPYLRLPGRHQLMIRLSIVGAHLAVLLLITIGLLSVNVIGLQRALLWQDVQRQNQYAIVDYQTASDSCLELYYPWPDLLRPRVRFLEQQHLAIFSSTALSQHAAANPSATCQKPYRDFIADAGGSYRAYALPRAQYHALEGRPLP